MDTYPRDLGRLMAMISTLNDEPRRHDPTWVDELVRGTLPNHLQRVPTCDELSECFEGYCFVLQAMEKVESYPILD